MSIAAGVDLRPTEEEFRTFIEMVEELIPEANVADHKPSLHYLMREDPRLARIAAALTRQAVRIAELESAVKVWLCPDCMTAYPELPGPADNVFTRFECPRCRGVVGIEANILLRKERETAAAAKRAYESQIAALSQVARDTSESTRDLVGALDDIANIDTAPDSPNAAGWRAVVVWCALRAKQGLEAFSHPLRPVLPVPEPPVPAPVPLVPPSHA